MKKISIILLVCLLLSLATVTAAPSIVTNSTSKIGTETFTINTAVNETSLINWSVSTGGSVIQSAIIGTNATSSSLLISNLDGNTDYTWQVDYTSIGDTVSIYNNLTTDAYLLGSVVRILLGLLGLIVASAGIISVMGSNIPGKGKVIATIIILLIIVIAFVNGVLVS